MTYADKFVAEVKQGGKILRVKDGAVYLPYGSEYSLLLKNLNSRRSSVKVSIDGEDVLDNHSLVLDPNCSTELQGFLRGNVARNSFRFINKTKEISDHRGDRADDGLIRIEFAFEKSVEQPWITNVIKEVHHVYNPPITFTYYGSNAEWNYINNDSTDKGKNHVYSSSAQPMSAAMPTSERRVTMDSLGVQNVSQVPNADEGITVKGSEVNQQFNYTTLAELEESSVIIIALKGITQTGQNVSQPVTAQGKLTCSSCGIKSKSSFKFCPNCGTLLE